MNKFEKRNQAKLDKYKKTVHQVEHELKKSYICKNCHKVVLFARRDKDDKLNLQLQGLTLENISDTINLSCGYCTDTKIKRNVFFRLPEAVKIGPLMSALAKTNKDFMVTFMPLFTICRLVV